MILEAALRPTRTKMMCMKSASFDLVRDARHKAHGHVRVDVVMLALEEIDTDQG